MNRTHRPLWARTLIEAGKTAVFLASFFALGTFINGAIHFQPGAMLILGMLIALGAVIAYEYWREWRTR